MADAMFYMRVRGKVTGPFDIATLQKLVRRGTLARIHEISSDRAAWNAAGQYEDLFPSAPAPVVQPAAAVADAPVENKRKVTTAPAPAKSPQMSDQPSPAPQLPPMLVSKPVGRGRTTMIASVIGVLAAIIVVCCIFILPHIGARHNIADIQSDSQTSSPNTEDALLSKAVGMIVTGAHVVDPLGKQTDVLESTGTCFVISRSGYLVTNKHVVENAWELENAKALTERLYNEKMIKVEARVWIFFGHKKDFAQITYVSPKFDLAILKVDHTFDVALNLSNEFRGARGNDVMAVGYPAIARKPLSKASIIDSYLKNKQNSEEGMDDVSLFFNESDFIYTLTKGAISRTYQELDGARWIQHEALIAHGNSGGPLVRPDGLVLGINTAGSTEDDSKAQIGNALEISQLREEIDGCVRDVMWK